MTPSDPKTMNGEEALDQLVLSEFPYPIAVNYQRLLQAKGWEARTRKCIEVFEFGLRAITLGALSQYLIRDVHQVSDLDLDRKLYRRLSQASLGQWTEFLFLALRAYRGKRNLFFLPELYDFYWDTSKDPHQPRQGLRAPFNRIIEIRNDIAHRLPPENEAAWEELGRDAMEQLRTILAQFSFLQHYDLIRVTGQRRDEYEYERYTGQEITSHCERLQGRGELRQDWFYLSRQDRSVLRLHPLLIFWTGKDESTEAEWRDAAVYDRLLKSTVEYAATVVRQTLKEHDADLLAQFRQLIYYNIEHIKMARKRTVLSWAGLRQAANSFSAEQMETAQEKYRRDLYLQRDNALNEFREFLASDKGCLVLTGKSGVGKSNFVLSLADEFADQEDICLLMYNAARLSSINTMVQAISQDLARYLTLEGEAVKDLFTELERQGEMQGKTLIVIFDAINENANGKMLLRHIDQMVGEVRYPWLKVMITSRPQAWRALKRGLRLAEERYYRRKDSDEQWGELRDLAVQLAPFRREELPNVYRKYHQAFGLQTEYEALRPSIQNALRDPLMLRLVAEIYQGQPIPDQIQVGDIYSQYVQALLVTERLYEEDIILVEQELMPLMISESHYDNKLTSSQVHAAKMRDGRPLWELIRSDDQLSNGRRVNDSYVRLVDAEILAEQGPPTDYEIAFKYERFYDHYGGKRLLEVIEQQGNEREATYRELIATLRHHPFLWGPLKLALTAELSQGNTELFVSLSQIPDNSAKQILVTTLSEYGQDHIGSVRPILGQLGVLKEDIDKTHPGRDRREDISSSLFAARKVAIETAAELELGEILVIGATDSSASVRMYAAQQIHWLWNRNDQVSLEVLSRLSQQIKTRAGIPKVTTLESLIGASTLIAFEHYRDAVAMNSLQQIWRRILEQLLFIRESETGIGRTLRKRIRNLAVSLAVRSLVGLMRRFGSPRSHLTIPELEHFIHQDPSERQKAEDLLPYLDPDHGSLENVQELLISIGRTRDIFMTYLAQLVLSAHSEDANEDILPALDLMFKEWLQLDPPGPAILAILNCLFTLLSEPQDGADETLDRFSEYVWEFYLKSNGVYHTDVQQYQHSGLELLILRNYEVHDTFYPARLETYLAESTKLGNFTLHKQLLCYHETEMTFSTLDVVAAFGYPTLALRIAELLLDAEDEDTQNGLYRFLARLRWSYQDDVDDFIEEFKLPANKIHQAEADVSALTVGDFLAVTSAPFLSEIQAYPMIRQEVYTLFEGMLESSSVGGFFELFVKRIVNFVYGSPVFDIAL